MGGAASVNSNSSDASSPDFTNRDEFLKGCNLFYDTMQSIDGTASKSRIYAVLSGVQQASEILNVFMLYCPEGRMSADRFIDLCRDTRLLGKTFTSENASAAFVSGRLNYCQNEGPEGVNYAGFLYHVIPELALAKEMDEEVLTDRLSHHHMPSPAVEKKISFKRLNSPAKPQSVKRGAPKTLDETIADEKEEDVANGTEKELGLHLVSHHIREVVQQANEGLDMDATVKKQAAVRIQSKFRCRIAKRKAAHLKLMKKGKRLENITLCPKLKPKIEKALKKVFQFYCPNDDIDLEGYYALIKDSGLLGHKYLGVDAVNNFKETVAKVELASTSKKYHHGVRFGKRFTFMIFKDISLSFVALSTGLSYDAVVDTILKSNEE